MSTDVTPLGTVQVHVPTVVNVSVTGGPGVIVAEHAAAAVPCALKTPNTAATTVAPVSSLSARRTRGGCTVIRSVVEDLGRVVTRARRGAGRFQGGAGRDTATDFNAPQGDTKTGVEVF
jgi:hypothetical protein